MVAISVDPQAPPKVDTTGVDAYMHGLIEFGHAVVPGTTRVHSATGDDGRALLQVSSRVRFGPDAPEMTVHAARLYQLGEDQKIAEEQVIFFVLPQ